MTLEQKNKGDSALLMRIADALDGSTLSELRELL